MSQKYLNELTMRGILVSPRLMITAIEKEAGLATLVQVKPAMWNRGFSDRRRFYELFFSDRLTSIPGLRTYFTDPIPHEIVTWIEVKGKLRSRKVEDSQYLRYAIMVKEISILKDTRPIATFGAWTKTKTLHVERESDVDDIEELGWDDIT